jgi:hypothetical protein
MNGRLISDGKAVALGVLARWGKRGSPCMGFQFVASCFLAGFSTAIALLYSLPSIGLLDYRPCSTIDTSSSFLNTYIDFIVTNESHSSYEGWTAKS